MNVFINGTGMCVPKKIISNLYFEKVGSSDNWIFNNLGIKERRITVNESTSDLASMAGIEAISNAGLTPDDIELIIVATSTPDKQAPSCASYVQNKIKAFNAGAFDISAVCTGALYALSVAYQFIKTGTYKNVLVIGADTFSKVTDWKRRDSVFFGDGAGAIVLSQTEENKGFIDFNLFSDGRGAEIFTIENKEPQNSESKSYFHMDGKGIYQGATTAVPKAINKLLVKNNFSIDEIDLLIPHQPSISILKSIAKDIGLPFEKVFTNMDKYANTSGATVSLAYHDALQKGLLKDAKYILLAAVGSGMAWGSALYKFQ
ncbi:3-oxoacyl-(acyl-carrier-protein) synthase, KASIII FabH [Psychroflexus torquis ATCC 700755]|uniref:3-oxoacyl-(Acyl-carrier-protein) synthase, KASIII FabH n=2 Tax=Psychroflexus TaxID=83612 RepID=K4IHG3_PSYTT|nr:3-oxoacyl-(acyl-carrier-protein) synthase, KASIII FabH [Psychroflexus torquis ATCC 700755]